MGTKALHLVWMSYRGRYMLTGSLPENSHLKSSHKAILGKSK